MLDVALEWAPAGGLDDPDQPRRKNLVPDTSVRPVAGAITVEVGGALIMLDVTVTIVIKGVGLLDDPESAKTHGAHRDRGATEGGPAGVHGRDADHGRAEADAGAVGDL